MTPVRSARVTASAVMKWCAIVSMGGVFVFAFVAAFQFLRANPEYVTAVVLLGFSLLLGFIVYILSPKPPDSGGRDAYRKGRD